MTHWTNKVGWVGFPQGGRRRWSWLYYALRDWTARLKPFFPFFLGFHIMSYRIEALTRKSLLFQSISTTRLTTGFLVYSSCDHRVLRALSWEYRSGWRHLSRSSLVAFVQHTFARWMWMWRGDPFCYYLRRWYLSRRIFSVSVCVVCVACPFLALESPLFGFESTFLFSVWFVREFSAVVEWKSSLCLSVSSGCRVGVEWVSSECT